MQTTIQFHGLPFISPNYKGDRYRSIRYKIKEWMSREFKQIPSKIYVDMQRNRGMVTFKMRNEAVKETIRMIQEHPMGQLFFDWSQRIKTTFALGSRIGPRPKLSLPNINYVQRFAECRHQAIMDAMYLDQLIFEEEGILSLMLSEIAIIEANQGLDEIDEHLDELQIKTEPIIENTEESHPLILEFSSDEEDSDEEDSDDELKENYRALLFKEKADRVFTNGSPSYLYSKDPREEPPLNVKLPYHLHWVATTKGADNI